MIDLNNNITSHINDKFALIKYKGWNDIPMMTSNNYVNIIKFCKDSDQEFSKWALSKTTRELAVNTSLIRNIPLSDIIITIKDITPPVLNGVYIHPDLLPSFVTWVDHGLFI